MVDVGSASTALIVLRGNSGSGRSTDTRTLQDRLELAVVGQNVLRRDMLGVGDRRDNPAVDLIDLVARFALDRGMHVVVEGILRRHNTKGRSKFGESELRQWWRDQDVLYGCGERVIGAEQDPEAIVDLITTAIARCNRRRRLRCPDRLPDASFASDLQWLTS